MIYTDLKLFLSDNPENDYQELHDFAKKCGMTKGYHLGETNDIPYYPCFKRNVREKLLLYGAILVARRTIMIYINHGVMRYYSHKIDYAKYVSGPDISKCIYNIVRHNKIKGAAPYGFVPTSQLRIVFSKRLVKVKYYMGKERFLFFQIGHKYPDGLSYIFNRETGESTPLELPDSIGIWIEDKKRFLKSYDKY